MDLYRSGVETEQKIQENDWYLEPLNRKYIIILFTEFFDQQFSSCNL